MLIGVSHSNARSKTFQDSKIHIMWFPSLWHTEKVQNRSCEYLRPLWQPPKQLFRTPLMHWTRYVRGRAPALKSTENIDTDDKRLHALLAWQMIPFNSWCLASPFPPGMTNNSGWSDWPLQCNQMSSVNRSTKSGIAGVGQPCMRSGGKSSRKCRKGRKYSWPNWRSEAMPKIYNCYSIWEPKISLFLDTSKITQPPFLLWQTLLLHLQTAHRHLTIWISFQKWFLSNKMALQFALVDSARPRMVWVNRAEMQSVADRELPVTFQPENGVVGRCWIPKGVFSTKK